MPKIDFNKIDDVVDFSPLPPGKYMCKLADIEEASTQGGDEMWNLKFQVIDGEHTGRYVFDRLVFSQAALKRVKLVCSRLGINVDGELDLTPQMLAGRTCLLSIQNEEYEDNEGNKKNEECCALRRLRESRQRSAGRGPGSLRRI
jgi:hypothetical protein